MKSIKKLVKIIMIVTVAFIITVGCAPKEPTPAVANTCPIPTGFLVDEAFATAKSTLSNPECRYKFETIFSALLNTCSGAPELRNKELFSQLLVWSKNEGIISKIQAKEYYTKYFSSRFISLPGDYSTCSHCPRLRSIMAECKSELQAKELGLLKACNDKLTYNKAFGDLDKIELILEATCSACSL
ncbi:MAG: hypothetical protein B6I31_03990 [Desulfobacteraceae bacterium 4572_19]|nr:MAG: hypothetical protein B6I31_03990 [Desulfobacteraceae bacterium 4572_19]